MRQGSSEHRCMTAPGLPGQSFGSRCLGGGGYKGRLAGEPSLPQAANELQPPLDIVPIRGVSIQDHPQSEGALIGKLKPRGEGTLWPPHRGTSNGPELAEHMEGGGGYETRQSQCPTPHPPRASQQSWRGQGETLQRENQEQEPHWAVAPDQMVKQLQALQARSPPHQWMEELAGTVGLSPPTMFMIATFSCTYKCF